jgi:transcriptional regulator with XRE-family HTH domain
MEKCWNCGGELSVIKDQPYRYLESGLDNVYIHGLVQYRCPSCDQPAAEIPKVKALHRLIARDIVCMREALSGDEVRFLRKELGMKGKEVADALAIEPETYSRWENGKQTVAPCHDRQLRLIYILNESEEEGRIIHRNIRKMISNMATLPSAHRKIDIAPAEWMMEENGPEYCDTRTGQ